MKLDQPDISSELYFAILRSVSKKMSIFCISYIWVAIGFMMMFIILFSGERSLKINNFPGTIVTILVMMLGEIGYTDLQFPSDQVVINGTISKVDVQPQFPFTAHLTLIFFILIFCLVIMNLLVGIAVSDIRQIVKTSKRDQLMAQVELACSVLNFSRTQTFEYLPDWIQSKFRRWNYSYIIKSTVPILSFLGCSMVANVAEPRIVTV